MLLFAEFKFVELKFNSNRFCEYLKKNNNNVN